MDQDHHQLDELFSAFYEELRRLAARIRRDDPSATLNPTALVNEAYLKLAASQHLHLESRRHFKRIAARAIRQVLVEAARRRKTQKRGGDLLLVTFGDHFEASATSADDLLELDAALETFARIHPRQAQVVELRFFGGLALHEIAQLLVVSDATVDRDWRSARAWLARELRPDR